MAAGDRRGRLSYPGDYDRSNDYCQATRYPCVSFLLYLGSYPQFGPLLETHFRYIELPLEPERQTVRRLMSPRGELHALNRIQIDAP